MAVASPPVVKTPLRLPPGPKGHFLLGNLAAVSRDWLGFYAQCARDYGDVVHLRYLHVPICLLMHPRDIEYVLVTNPGNFTQVRGLPRPCSRGRQWLADQRRKTLAAPARPDPAGLPSRKHFVLCAGDDPRRQPHARLLDRRRIAQRARGHDGRDARDRRAMPVWRGSRWSYPTGWAKPWK